MRNRRDMYINYERSYRQRRRRGRSRAGFILLVIFLALGLGFLAYYLVSLRMNSGNNRTPIDHTDPLVQNPEDTDLTSTESTEQNTQEGTSITPEPVALPTIMPTTAGTDPEETKTIEVDTRIPVKVKGIYVTGSVAGNTNLINRLTELADTTEINAMVIDVKNDSGRITYAMDGIKASEIGANTNTVSDMEQLVKALKNKKIYLIARIVAFKDPFLTELRPDLAIKNQDGSIYRDNNGEGWVNPYKQEVWEYLIEVSKKAAAIGFDEIQFDYIRIPTGKGIADADFGEEAKTKSKEEVIIEFTKYAYEAIKPLGIFVSADVYGTIISSSIDAGLVGQNYVEMSKYLDYISPMVYPSHFGEGNYGIEHPDLEPYNIIRKVMVASKTKLDLIPEGEHRAIVRPWLQDFTATWVKPHMDYGGEELKEQIKGVYDAGYEEWLLWNASCVYSEDGLNKE